MRYYLSMSNAEQLERKCGRCGGKPGWQQWGQVYGPCYKCGGTGRVLTAAGRRAADAGELDRLRALWVDTRALLVAAEADVAANPRPAKVAMADRTDADKAASWAHFRRRSTVRKLTLKLAQIEAQGKAVSR